VKDGIALNNYAYVSLFGVNSLEEFKYSICENSVTSSDIGVEPSLETLQSNTNAVVKRISKRSLWFFQQTPIIKNYSGALGPVWFLSVKKTIVCVDDVERRGKDLSVREVMGLVSSLKEHKGCKIALILNDEALDDRVEFDKYFEKVVDISLKFAPSAEECTKIALNLGRKANKILAESCVTLGISNIRLIKKIERSVHKIEPMLSRFDEQVLEQAVKSLALLGWSVYEPATAPPLDCLRKRGSNFFASAKKEVVPEKEAAWNALLDVYGFVEMDDFDLTLLDGIQNGFFDPAMVEKHASEWDRRITTAKLDGSFNDAWRLYHDSFADNAEEVLDAIYPSFIKNVQNIAPGTLNGTVRLFRALGRPAQAEQMINRYVTREGADRNVFDLERSSFPGEMFEPDIVCAFKAKLASLEVKQNPTDVLLSMANTNGWNPEDIEILSTTPIEQYYGIFMKSNGDVLRKAIRACLQFDVISNATEPMKEISNRAKEALKRIGKESPLNAQRVRRYGVKADETLPE
jgi:hypothetical protein